MKNQFYKVIIWSMLVALVLISIPSVIRYGPDTIKTTFVESYEFESEMDDFYRTVSKTVLNPIEFEEAKEKLTVSASEIETHRTWYGSLSEQVQNIRGQYAHEIIDAEEEGDTQLKEILIAERDGKIADIMKNFEDDAHVAKKVLAEKTRILQEYIADIRAHSVGAFPVAYQLIDLETGQEYKKGDVNESAYYEKTFTKERPFIAYSINVSYNISNTNSYTETSVNNVATEDSVSGERYSIPLTQIMNPPKQFEGKVIVSKKAFNESSMKERAKNFAMKKYRNLIFWTISFIALILLFTKFKFKREWLANNRFVKRYETLKVDMKALIFIITLLFTVNAFIPNATYRFFTDDFYLYYLHGWAETLVALVFVTISVLILSTQLFLIVDRWKVEGMFEKDLLESYTAKFFIALRDMFLNRSLGVQTFILLIGFFLAGIGFIAVVFEPFLILAYIPAVLFFGLPALYIFVRRAGYMNRIFKATEEMAAGRLNEEIKIEGKSPFAKHAKNLNNLREGVKISMSEQAKSERLKTELITNVSHDLRTPLTSIITYTDLLKSEHLTEEERLKYVDVLDKKSARLKMLIDDLFEVSKMASGNVELYRNEVNLAQLLQQALGEHEEEIKNSDLDFRVQIPDYPLIAYVDGQRWWRVLDNLILNALKYSMPNTRVYLTLENVQNKAQFVIKNISKYELNDNGDELFERFKRADTSRHTEGSGLGLAIAQSIVDMHSGRMEIDIDGDLFKVTVEIPIQ